MPTNIIQILVPTNISSYINVYLVARYVIRWTSLYEQSVYTH